MKKTLLLLIIILIISCKKNDELLIKNSFENFSTLNDVKMQMMKTVALISKISPEFRNQVETECNKQVRGDFNVTFDRLIEIDQDKSFIPKEFKPIFKNLVSQLKKFRPNEMPIIFIPVLETRLDAKNKNSYYNEKLSPPSDNIIMVDQDFKSQTNQIMKSQSIETITSAGKGGNDPEPCDAPYYYPGYVVQNNGDIVFEECISEQIAYTKDVWVFGFEEDVSIENQVANNTNFNTYNFASSSTRLEGISEYGGLIQILNLGEIEPWIRGKIELKYFVYNSSGTLIKEKSFGKIKRSVFYDQRFVNLKDFIGNWNTSNWGATTYERWIEENRGQTVNLSQNINYVVNGVSFSTNITTQIKSEDSNLGYANVQFTDQPFQIPILAELWVKYNFYHMNMYRHNALLY